MSGKLNSINLASNTPAILYSNLSHSPATVTLSICNKNLTTTNVRVALIDGLTVDAVTDADYIEYDLAIGSRNVLERTAIVVGYQQSIYVFSSLASVSAVAWGFTA